MNGVSTEEYIRELRQRLKENPVCALTHYNLGVALIKQYKWDEAISEFEEAIAKSPRLAEAYINLSGIYFRKGEMEKGIDLLSLAYLQKGEFKKAICHCDRALEYGYEVHPDILAELEAFRE